MTDILIGPYGGMDLILNRRILRRQAESVPAHGVQHRKPLGALIPRDDIAEGINPDMADMDEPRGIGEHLQYIAFVAASGRRRCEGTVLIPGGLPSRFDFLEIVSWHGGGGSKPGLFSMGYRRGFWPGPRLGASKSVA